jgi:hypothetical protein
MSQIAEQNTAITNAAISASNYQTAATIFGTIGSMAGTYSKVNTPTKPVE